MYKLYREILPLNLTMWVGTYDSLSQAKEDCKKMHEIDRNEETIYFVTKLHDDDSETFILT